MTFSGNENDIALFSHHAGGTDSFLTVNDREHLFHLLRGKTCQHIVDDVLWFLITGIVGGNDDTVALLYSFLSHQRTLSFVTVASCSTDGDNLALLALQHLTNGIQHILQSVGGVGIVYNSGNTLL